VFFAADHAPDGKMTASGRIQVGKDGVRPPMCPVGRPALAFRFLDSTHPGHSGRRRRPPATSRGQPAS